MLEIKSKSSMLGYLNAPSPFTDDGWFKTGDSVEKNGEYIKIIGRKSEIINVGGEKVYPQEVENVLLSHPIIKDVTVYGEKNLITGNIVCAKIKITDLKNKDGLENELKRFCSRKLEKFKVPLKFHIEQDNQHNLRFKKIENK